MVSDTFKLNLIYISILTHIIINTIVYTKYKNHLYSYDKVLFGIMWTTFIFALFYVFSANRVYDVQVSLAAQFFAIVSSLSMIVTLIRARDEINNKKGASDLYFLLLWIMIAVNFTVGISGVIQGYFGFTGFFMASVIIGFFIGQSSDKI